MNIINPYFDSVASLLVLIPLLVEIAKIKLKLKSLALQVFSWVIGLVLSIIGYIFNLGMFVEFDLLYSIGIGIVISLASNGVADTGFLQNILEQIKNKFPKMFK